MWFFFIYGRGPLAFSNSEFTSKLWIIMDTWQDSLHGGSPRRKAFIFTVQHNTEKGRYTPMLRVGFELTITAYEPSKTATSLWSASNYCYKMKEFSLYTYCCGVRAPSCSSLLGGWLGPNPWGMVAAVNMAACGRGEGAGGTAPVRRGRARKTERSRVTNKETVSPCSQR
jgi:hypothetical protein